MRQRMIAMALTVLLCVLCTVSVSAAGQSLLSVDQTRLTSETGMFAYTPEGALTVTASDAGGVTAAIDLNMTVNVYETPFIQLSLTSTAAFNVALKLGTAEGDIFPQTAGPAWYEGFQKHAPAAGGGVDAGSYTLSLSIPAYAEYNELAIPKDGVVTLKTVFVMLKGEGGLTLEHLTLSEHGEFQTAFGKTGQTAYSPIAITTAAKGQIPTTPPSYDAGGVTRFQSEGAPVGVIVLLIVAALAVAGMSVVNARRKPK